jgi:hypothetical protein
MNEFKAREDRELGIFNAEVITCQLIGSNNLYG